MKNTNSAQTAHPVILSARKFEAVIFDMDGVVTRTANVHYHAWKKIFDQFLQQRFGSNYKPFTKHDYLSYVDGRPRADGIKTFLASRQINLPEGKPDDKPGTGSVHALGSLKTDEFLRIIHACGVEPYETTLALIRALRAVNVKTGLVTASKNCGEILAAANIGHLFESVVSGIDAAEHHLAGKPAPDTYLHCARMLDVEPGSAVVVEDAEAGVAAGRAGGFGLVIGVARSNNTQSLLKSGADEVVTDLAAVVVPEHQDPLALGTALADLEVTDANWVVSYDKFEPEKELARESLCALGNGKFCTRGAAAEATFDGVHYPGTYVAGGYDTARLEADGGYFEREELVNMPNWLCMNFRIDDDDWFDMSKVEVLEYCQRLELRNGLLYRNVKFRDNSGRETRLQERRFVHMRYSHLAGTEICVTALNWSGRLTMKTALDGRVVNAGDDVDPRFKAVKHLDALEHSSQGDVLFLKMATRETKLVIAEAAKTVFLKSAKPVELERQSIVDPEYVEQQVTVELKPSESLTAQKTLALYTSRDRGIYEAGVTATRALAIAPNFETLVDRQIQAWCSLWRQFDLFIETNEEHSKLVPSLLLHLNSFHSIQTASPHTIDLDTGVPARGWTGEGYQGHIFWDDLFVFPFINLRLPNISAALLKYRYRRVNEARRIATAYGAKGACFPWQSASDGRERTPEYWWMPANQKWIRDYTHLELHVNGAIAYNVWQYFQVTGDIEFIYSYGAEVLVEIARFFATYAKLNSKTGRYEIHGVIGPDEFHNAYPGAEKPGVNNNAYTNIIAAWTISRALELLRILPSDLRTHVRQRFEILDDELQLWEAVSSKMFVPMSDDGIIYQFEGYEKLQEFPGLPHHKIDANVLKRELDANDGYLNQYKIAKQADVLMLWYLFSPEELDEIFKQLGYKYKVATMAVNASYYIPRTANQSTLSRVVHAWVLSRLDRLSAKDLLPPHVEDALHGETSAEIFYEALGSDFYDVVSRGTTKTGIHMGAMAGTVDIVQRCYTGIVTRGDVLWLNPHLPEPMVHLSFNIHYRRQSLSFDITKDSMKVVARHSSAEPIKIGYDGKVYDLNAGETRLIPLKRVRPTEQEKKAA